MFKWDALDVRGTDFSHNGITREFKSKDFTGTLKFNVKPDTYILSPGSNQPARVKTFIISGSYTYRSSLKRQTKSQAFGYSSATFA